MARKPRLELAGAIYHVLSRGNYRKELFDDGSARLFEKTLFEAAAKCGWLLRYGESGFFRVRRGE
jgi:putative transposase